MGAEIEIKVLEEKSNNCQNDVFQDIFLNMHQDTILNIPQNLRSLIANFLYFRDFNGYCDNDDFYETDESGFKHFNVDACLNNWLQTSRFKILQLNIRNGETKIVCSVYKRKISESKKSLIVVYEGVPILVYKTVDQFNEFYISNLISISDIHTVMTKLSILDKFNELIENSVSLRFYSGTHYEQTLINNYNGHVSVTDII